MANPGDEFPAGEDYLVRRLKDLERQVSENASARSLAASQIGSGGLLINGGGSLTISGTGSLNVGSGALNSAGSIAAGTTISAGGAITGASLGVGTGAIAGGAITGASVAVTGAASSATVTTTGNATVGGSVPVTGDVFIPNRTPVVSGYFGLWVNSDGRIGISSSARRYKQDIAPHAYTLDQIALIQIVNYRLITAVALLGDAARVEVGVVAEQLIDAGMPEFVAFNADGTTESVAYERLNLVAIAGVQQLIGRVRSIEARLAAANIA